VLWVSASIRKFQNVTTWAVAVANVTAQVVDEGVVGRVVGPQREHAAGAEMPAESAESGRRVEVRVARVEQVSGRVVDVDQQRIEPIRVAFVQHRRVVPDELEEVTVDQPAARVLAERAATRDEVASMPVDHRLDRVDHAERSHPFVLQRGSRGVAEAEPADCDVDQVSLDGGEPEPRERLLAVGEQAGHQAGSVEDHLEDVDLQRDFEPAPQDDVTHRRRGPCELLEGATHARRAIERRASAVRTTTTIDAMAPAKAVTVSGPSAAAMSMGLRSRGSSRA
jgi:hypothetical protein